MDAGDITILQLKQHGINIDAQAGIGGITSEVLYLTLLQSFQILNILTEQEVRKQFPSKLPSAKSARFGICDSLTKYLTTAGYSASSYDAIMYPTENMTKPLLNWLVAELGRAAENAADVHGDADDENASSMSSLQRGVLSLAGMATEVEKIVTSKSAKAAGGRALLLPPRRHNVPIRRNVFTVPAAVWAEDGSLISQVEDAHAEFGKVPLLPAEQHLKPDLSQTIIDSISEASARFWVADEKRLDEWMGANNLVLPNADSGNQRTAKKAKRVVAVTSGNSAMSSIDAMFMNTSEDGLDGDGSRALAARRAREAAAEADVKAAVEGLAEKQKSVQDRAAQRETEASDIKAKLHDTKKMVRGKREILNELQARLDQAQAGLDQTKADFAERRPRCCCGACRPPRRRSSSP